MRGGRESRSLLIALIGLAVLLLLGALGAISHVALDVFEEHLAPEAHKKAGVIGRSLSAQIERALGYGIPLPELVGMDPFLDGVLEGNPDIEYLAVVDLEGQLRYHRGVNIADSTADMYPARRSPEPRLIGAFFDTRVPITANGKEVATLHVGMAEGFVTEILAENFYDVLTVLLVTVLITFEFLAFFVIVSVTLRIRVVQEVMELVASGDLGKRILIRGSDEIARFGRGLNMALDRVSELYHELRQEARETKAAQIDKSIIGRIDALMKKLEAKYRFVEPGQELPKSGRSPMSVRIPLFLFIFSEELSRSFLPLYIRELYSPIAGLSPEMTIGLPITVFMLVVLLVTPIAGSWTDRFGARRLFLLGTVPAAAGYLGTAFADNLYDLLLWRSLTAVGYATVYIACQAAIANITPASNRAQGMAVFMGAVFVAGICGPAIGGLIADRASYQIAFLCSLGLALLSAFLVFRMLGPDTAGAPRERPRMRLSDVIGLASNMRFMSLAVLAAIPGKIILTGFLFYLAPLYLFELGNSQSEIGRIMMCYGLVIVVVMPLTARLADRLSGHAGFIAVGGLIAGAGCLGVLQMESTWTVLAAIALLGLGHGLNISPQLALVQEIATTESRLGQASVLAIFRLIERLGSVVGPFLAAWMLDTGGYAVAMAGFGILLMVTALLFAIVYGLAGGRLWPRRQGAPA